jgi:hypothetical protein
MCHCWDCVQKPHCLCRGRGGGPCKYYIGPAKKKSPDRSCELVIQAPHIWNLPAVAKAKIDELKPGARRTELSIKFCAE